MTCTSPRPVRHPRPRVTRSKLPVATYRSLSALSGYALNFDPFSLAAWLYSLTDNNGTFWTYDNRRPSKSK